MCHADAYRHFRAGDRDLLGRPADVCSLSVPYQASSHSIAKLNAYEKYGVICVTGKVRFRFEAL